MLLVDVCRPTRPIDEITNVCLCPLRSAIGEFSLPVSLCQPDDEDFVLVSVICRIYALLATLLLALMTLVGALCWWIDSLIHRDLYQIREANYLDFQQFLNSFPALLRCREIFREVFCSESPIEEVCLQTHEVVGNSLGQVLSRPNVQGAREVCLSFNSLSEVPAEIEHFESLEVLNLSANAISALPVWLGNLPNLRLLDVSRNLIREIPAELARLPRECTIIARNCLLSSEQCRLFQDLIAIARSEDPTRGPRFDYSIYDGGLYFGNFNWHIQPGNEGVPGLDPLASIDISSEIDQLKREFTKREFGVSFQVNWQKFKELLLGMEREGKLAACFFKRLTTIADYRQHDRQTSEEHLQRQKSVILRFDQIASKMVEDSTFCRTAYSLFEQAVSSCSDRIDHYFSELEIEVLLANATRLSDEKLVELCVGVRRRKLLLQHAELLAEERQFGDPLETVLAFERGLKDALQLPGLGQGLLYMRCSNVTEELLNEGKKKILDQTKTRDQKTKILLEFPCWLDRLRSKFSEAFERLDDEAMAAKTKEKEIEVAVKYQALYRECTQKLLTVS